MWWYVVPNPVSSASFQQWTGGDYNKAKGWSFDWQDLHHFKYWYWGWYKLISSSEDSKLQHQNEHWYWQILLAIFRFHNLHTSTSMLAKCTRTGGGVFCWDESMARLDSCDIDGGHSYAFISFGDCNSQLCSSTIRGVCINKDQISKEFGSDNDIILPEYASQLTISPKAFLPISANELRRGFDQTYY